MKKLVLFVTLVAVSTLTKADTIDFWHVYYHGKEVSDISSTKPLVLKAGGFPDTDSLTIRYFTDRGCPTCTTGIIIFDPEDYIVTEITGPDSSPLSFSLQTLADYPQKEFLIYYYKQSRQRLIFLFKIILE